MLLTPYFLCQLTKGSLFFSGEEEDDDDDESDEQFKRLKKLNIFDT